MDENLFFKQATLLICSSLDIETALWRLRQYMARHIPADEIYLNIFDPALGGLRYVARADAVQGEKLEQTIRLPHDLIESIEGGQRLKDYLIINQPEKDPMGVIITRELNLKESSFIALRLKIEGHRLGVIDLFARGRNRYTEAHARRFALLREPIAIAMANALRHQETVQLKEQLLSDNRYLHGQLISMTGDEMVGANSGLKSVSEKIAQVAGLKTTVLLMGETGVGKEVVANTLHRLSPRSNGPFIKVNCGAIPENLIDSELFGHERGAFTGAVEQKRGRFERADKGTIFLDEIGELPPWAQVRLLRVLQTQEIERVGGSPPIKLDIRVIAATHRDIQQMVDNGDFRDDLWFRINAFPITIPPLRRRQEDISLLVAHLLHKKSQELGINEPPRIAPGAMQRLKRHDWPGNVRELENTVERALIQHRQGPLFFHRLAEKSPASVFSAAMQHEDARALTLDELARTHIEEILQVTGGRVSGTNGAAVILGLHPNTLRHRMQKLGIAHGRRAARTHAVAKKQRQRQR